MIYLLCDFPSGLLFEFTHLMCLLLFWLPAFVFFCVIWVSLVNKFPLYSMALFPTFHLAEVDFLSREPVSVCLLCVSNIFARLFVWFWILPAPCFVCLWTYLSGSEPLPSSPANKPSVILLLLNKLLNCLGFVCIWVLFSAPLPRVPGISCDSK